MRYELFKALPEFLSSTAKELLLETDLDEATGKLTWPRIVLYEFINEWQERLRHSNPPKTDVNYLIHVLNAEAWEYLCKTGWAYDERHTGRRYKVVDNRKAPGA